MTQVIFIFLSTVNSDKRMKRKEQELGKHFYCCFSYELTFRTAERNYLSYAINIREKIKNTII